MEFKRALMINIDYDPVCNGSELRAILSAIKSVSLY